jgi:PqqD family protein of HPr-rel-A system
MVQRYAAPPIGACLRADAEGLTLLYHRRSGQTHILAEPAPQILEALAGAAMTEAELLVALAADFEVTQPQVIGERLSELIASGLVSVA